MRVVRYSRMTHSEILCNLRGLAAELQLPREWLATEADAGRIPCLRIGHRRLFNVEAVRRTLAARAAVQYSEAPCATT